MQMQQDRNVKLARILGSLSLLLGIGITWTPWYAGSNKAHAIAGFFIGCAMPLTLFAVFKSKRPTKAA